jgi:hypothetical protein
VVATCSLGPRRMVAVLLAGACGASWCDAAWPRSSKSRACGSATFKEARAAALVYRCGVREVGVVSPTKCSRQVAAGRTFGGGFLFFAG